MLPDLSRLNTAPTPVSKVANREQPPLPIVPMYDPREETADGTESDDDSDEDWIPNVPDFDMDPEYYRNAAESIRSNYSSGPLTFREVASELFDILVLPNLQLRSARVSDFIRMWPQRLEQHVGGRNLLNAPYTDLEIAIMQIRDWVYELYEIYLTGDITRAYRWIRRRTQVCYRWELWEARSYLMEFRNLWAGGGPRRMYT